MNTFKIGDKVRLTMNGTVSHDGGQHVGKIFTINKIDQHVDGNGNFFVTVEELPTPGQSGIWCSQLELVERLPETTSVEQDEVSETNAIVEALEDAAWYEGATENLRTPRAKSGDTLALLVRVLVAKGVISSKDVTRILNLKK